MARFLMQAHAPSGGLAHLGSAIAVGSELRDRGHEVTVAYGGTRPELIDDAGLGRREVAEVPADREWMSGEWFADLEGLRTATESHLALIDELEPDAIVACHGVHGRLAAEVRGVPRLHVFHYLHTTSFARAVSVNRDRLRDLRHPHRAWRVGRARLRRLRRSSPRILSLVAELRAEHGLGQPGRDAVAGISDTFVGATTAPFVVPARGMPPHWSYVGPLSWSAADGAPELPAGGGPLAYVTQGSTGDGELLEAAVRALVEDGFRVLASTGGLIDPARLATLGPGVAATELLDGATAMRAADLAVIHGGHQTLMEALRAGVPVLALPTRSDQIGHLHRVEGLGVGRGVFPPPARDRVISQNARRVLRAPIRRRCGEIAGALADGWDGRSNLASVAEQLAAGVARPAARASSTGRPGHPTTRAR